jgi:S-adenosylmethionine/arginine decarboxylase-like enzyme
MCVDVCVCVRVCGVCCIQVLAESHMSIHTWPEHHFAALDIFVCGVNGLFAYRLFACPVDSLCCLLALNC